MTIRLFTILLLASLLNAGISDRINTIVNDPKLSKVKIAVSVIHAESKQDIFHSNAYLPLVPASTMKIVTTSTALGILGEDFTFDTDICYDGKNIIIQGSGDPLLGEGDDITGQICDKVVENGITSIEDIIVDSTIFDDQLQHPDWPVEEINRSYQPEICGINYNLNCIDIEAWPVSGSVGYSFTPYCSIINISNKAKYTTKKSNTMWASREIESNNFTLYGECGFRSVPFSVPVHRPAVFLGYYLAEKLNERGITITGKLIEGTANCTGAKMIAQYSTTLTDVMTRANSESLNLAAECIAKVASAKFTGKSGSWESFDSIAKDFIKNCHADPNEVIIRDGCGLSREDRLTTNVLTKILCENYHKDSFEFFKSTMAVGGVSGSNTVRKYFTEPEYKGRIFAKSGTLTGVKALTGYCYTDSGVYVFAIITNNANGYTRKAINDIVQAIF